MENRDAKKSEPTFESLRTYQCPEWFRDAKFGIWSHWGPQSVPMCGDWYARNMYQQGTEQYNYHVRHYGHPSKFGYKDLCALWKAEKFDPDALMEKYYNAGARYFIAQASHHDNFFSFPSKWNRFNSVEVGPHKDICGLWKAAAEKYHIPFGVSEHLAYAYSWWRTNKGADSYGPYAGVSYDGSDPKYRDIYLDNCEYADDPTKWPLDRGLTDNTAFREYWLKVMKELIDLYEPDLLYSDSALPFGEKGLNDEIKDYQYGLDAVSYLYNKSISKYKTNHAVYTQKDQREEIYRVGTLDMERSQLSGIAKQPWQSDTCIGGWFYSARMNYLHPGQIIEILVDIISKNGTLLLNILQRPDGTIDDETDWILEELAKWFAINAEAVYGTCPWRIAGEGLSSTKIEAFNEERIEWNASDFRFVKKGEKLYAFIMCPKAGTAAVIRSIKETEHVKTVRLLGYGEVKFVWFAGVLTVTIPDKLPTEYVNALEITFA
ncbi:MAG TPA: alpha-L-fucosidase [Lachnospiraceae bacterium]|nr:alpha-L-fucosidase [Lachnospiraceae bacterium]